MTLNSAKMTEPIMMPFWIWTQMGQGTLRGGNFEGKRGGPLWTIGIPCRELCKNGWTNRDAICDMDSSSPRNYVLDGCPDTICEGQFWRQEGADRGHVHHPAVSILKATQKGGGQNQYSADADWVLECTRWDAYWHTWQIRLNCPCAQRCSLMWDYFHHSLKFVIFVVVLNY